MILVLASIADTRATEFAREFAGVADVAVVTCRDLAEGRTVLRYPDFAASTLQVGGRTIRIDEIDGAINALPAVFPEELIFFPPEEQEYQAAEFHALLTFLLRAVRAPVINRPAPGNLAGPFAGVLAWYHLAQGCGISTFPVAVDTHDFTNPSVPRAEGIFEVGCLDGSLIVTSGTAADHYTPALCRRAKVAYLRAAYRTNERDEPELLMVRTVPDLANDATRRALIDFFARRARRP